MLGYSVIALHNPKNSINVGGVFRAATIYNASLVVLGGKRVNHMLRQAADTSKAWRLWLSQRTCKDWNNV